MVSSSTMLLYADLDENIPFFSSMQNSLSLPNGSNVLMGMLIIELAVLLSKTVLIKSSSHFLLSLDISLSTVTSFSGVMAGFCRGHGWL